MFEYFVYTEEKNPFEKLHLFEVQQPKVPYHQDLFKLKEPLQFTHDNKLCS